ncbi:hypothetical protein JCM11251_007333 [Rhodosporidiobolus azoricus]
MQRRPPTVNNTIPPPPPPPDRVAPLSLLLLGTGPSSALPYLPCITSPTPSLPLSAGGCCDACADTLPRSEGGSGRKSKNVRGNTGAVLRVPPTQEEWERGEREEKTVLIDCGKTFREQALKLFRKHGLRKVDACVLSHHHADAIDGLDDLRAWTYHTAIERTIPIYCTATTYSFIRSSFPYMINKKAASGGGAIPSFEWHVMPDPEKEMEQGREVEDWEVVPGLRICPVPVVHGHYFDRPEGEPQRPLISLGFLIEQSLLYISDVSHIPSATFSLLSRRLSLPSSPSLNLPRLQALIIDSSSPFHPSASHFALPQALSTGRTLGAKKTYLTDIAHGMAHEGWVKVCEAVERGEGERVDIKRSVEGGNLSDEEGDEAEELTALSRLSRFTDLAINGPASPSTGDKSVMLRVLAGINAFDPSILPSKMWARPAVDGMVIAWNGNGGGEGVWDGEYGRASGVVPRDGDPGTMKGRDRT